MPIALTRTVPRSIADCELTHLTREPLDTDRASAQHREYEKTLKGLGCTVQRLPPEHELPDSVFVEDTAVVLREVAVITRPGAPSRRAETASVADALRAFRSLVYIRAPGTLDGGDVLVIGKWIFVGQSARTNAAGIRQLTDAVRPFDYSVETVVVTGCLHLKTAVTQVAADAVLLNPEWVDRQVFAEYTRIEIDPTEPFAANAVWVGGAAVVAEPFTLTRRRLDAAGITTCTVDASELAKAEAGLTCCSLLVHDA